MSVFSSNIETQRQARVWLWGIFLGVMAVHGLAHNWRREAHASSIATARNIAVKTASPRPRTSEILALPQAISAHEERLQEQNLRMTDGLKGQLYNQSMPPSPFLSGKRPTLWVYLPPGYANSARRFPVAYLLHGAPGEARDFWVNARAQRVLETLIETRKVAPMILICPDSFGPQGVQDAQNFLDSPQNGWKMESFWTKTLVPFVDANFRTIARSQARALVGFSAGGYGAANLGFKYPQIWKVAASISGFFDPGDDAHNFTRLLGPKSALWKANSPLIRAQNVPYGTRIHFYMDCGRDDPLFGEFQKMRAELHKNGADFQAQAWEGDHAWDYVHDRLFDAFKFCDARWKELAISTL